MQFTEYLTVSHSVIFIHSWGLWSVLPTSVPVNGHITQHTSTPTQSVQKENVIKVRDYLEAKEFS